MYPIKILDKKRYALCYLVAFICNIAIYIVPVLLALFTRPPFTLEKFVWLIALIAIAKVIEVATDHIWMTKVNKVNAQSVQNLQTNYLSRICKMPLMILNQIHSGYLKKQIDIVCTEFEDLFEQVLETVNGISISFTIFLISVYTQDVTMFFVCCGFVIALIVFNLFISKKYVPKQEEYNDSYSEYNSTYVDILQNMKTIKRLDASKYAKQKTQKEYRPVLFKYGKVNFINSIRFNGVYALLYIMFIGLLINLYFKMKSGQDILSYLVFYATIFTQISGELRDLSYLFQQYSKLKAADKQVEEMIGKYENAKTIEKWDEIRLKDVEFQYSKEETSITVPEFVLRKKEKVGIIGESGQGKTTFLNILSKAVELNKGNYFINGIEQEGNLPIAYVSQDIELLNVSIRENIALGKQVNEDDLMGILEEAGLKDWIDQLPDGLETIVGERGLKLSAGQKQRVNLVRGILLDKDIYILDEPTSNLDYDTEKRIVYLVEKYLKDKTIIIVTHRPEVLKICDRYYEFKEHTMKEIAKEPILY